MTVTLEELEIIYQRKRNQAGVFEDNHLSLDSALENLMLVEKTTKDEKRLNESYQGWNKPENILADMPPYHYELNHLGQLKVTRDRENSDKKWTVIIYKDKVSMEKIKEKYKRLGSTLLCCQISDMLDKNNRDGGE